MTEPCLSAREREIILLVAQGRQNKSIAAALKISHWTVATYVKRALKKLGVHSRAAMVAKVAESRAEIQRATLKLKRQTRPESAG